MQDKLKQLLKEETIRESDPKAVHLTPQKVRHLEKFDRDTPKLHAFFLIMGFILLIKALHFFAVFDRARASWSAFEKSVNPDSLIAFSESFSARDFVPFSELFFGKDKKKAQYQF